MAFTGVRFKNPDRYIKLWAQAPEKLKENLRLRFEILGRFFVNIAQTKHRFLSRSGKLESSIKYKIQKEPLVLTVGIPANHKYGHFVHAGTRPHWIYPKDGEAIKWNEGGPRFAKKILHPGTKQDPFVTNAVMKNMRKVNFEVNEAVRITWEQQGLS